MEATASHVVHPALARARRAGAPMACTSWGGSEGSGVEVNIFPAQAAHLTAPQTQREGEPQGYFKPFTARGL